MSFNISLNNAIDTIISSYISKISDKYNIDKTELMQMWNSKNTESESKSEVKPNSSNLDKDTLQKLTKNDLVNICKEKKIKHTGTKPELIDRLLEHKNKVVVEKPKSVCISEKIQTTLETIQIRKNKFGNYEHFETHIVFDKNNQNAIGTQNINGKIDTLTQEDIEQCKKYKFKFQLPSNITSKKLSHLSKTQNETVDEDNISDIEKEEKEDDNQEEIVIEDDGAEEDDDDEELDLDDDVEEVYESD
jgi:hypothetical protein